MSLYDKAKLFSLDDNQFKSEEIIYTDRVKLIYLFNGKYVNVSICLFSRRDYQLNKKMEEYFAKWQLCRGYNKNYIGALLQRDNKGRF